MQYLILIGLGVGKDPRMYRNLRILTVKNEIFHVIGTIIVITREIAKGIITGITRAIDITTMIGAVDARAIDITTMTGTVDVRATEITITVKNETTRETELMVTIEITPANDVIDIAEKKIFHVIEIIAEIAMTVTAILVVIIHVTGGEIIPRKEEIHMIGKITMVITRTMIEILIISVSVRNIIEIIVIIEKRMTNKEISENIIIVPNEMQKIPI